MATWYRTNSAALTWREISLCSNGRMAEFARLAGTKLSRGRGDLLFVFQAPDEPPLVNPDQIPPDHFAALFKAEGLLAKLPSPCSRVGLTCLATKGAITSAGLLALSEDGKVLVSVLSGKMVLPERSDDAEAMRSTSTWLATEFEDGVQLVTSNQRAWLASPPIIRSVHLPGAPIREAWRVHCDRIEAHARSSAARVFSPDGALAAFARNERLSRDLHVARGYYVPASDEELERLGVTA